MKKQKTKLAVLLLALGCASVGIGAGTISAANASNPTVTASAETTYTTYDLGALKVHANSWNGSFSCRPDQLYLAKPDGSAFPVQSWADGGFTLVSGDGLKVNGASVAFAGVTSTDAGLFMSLAGIQVGDIVTLSGTFVNETYATKYVIEECSFQWSGTIWENVGAYTTYEIGALDLHVNSSVGGASGANNVLYLQATDGKTFPILDWSFAFIPESADGFKVNGQPANLAFMKSTADGMYFEFFALNAGDIVTIDGAYKCAGNNTRYILGESKFIWTGSKWEKYIEVNYTEHNIGKLKFHTMQPGNTKMAYFNRVDGEAIPITTTENNAHWESKFSIWPNSGVGITLNGEAIDAPLKFPETAFVEMSAAPKAGDVLVIGGTFYNQNLAAKYIIEESSFKFNGTEWEAYTGTPETPEVTYTDYTATSVAATGDSSASVLYIYPTGGVEAFPHGGGDWDSKYAFEAGSGEGLKLNGEALSTDDIKLPGTDLFIALGVEAKTGDILTIDGAYSNAAKGIRIIFENCTLQWNGSAWEASYSTYEIGALDFHINSSVGGASGANNVLYLQAADGKEFPILAWEYLFVNENADCFKVNGEAATLYEMKSTPDGMYFAFDALKAGDVITISGTYVCEAKSTKYVIAESKFAWNGTGWEKYVEYTNHEVGTMKILPQSTATAVSLYTANEVKLPVNSWDYVFLFRQGSGIGLTLNGEPLATKDIKSPGGDLYIGLQVTAQAGDVLAIGGTYYNVDTGIAYIISESSFIFNGEAWVNEIDQVKANAATALDEYKATFAQENYYEAEWASFDTIIENAKASINAATTKAEVEGALTAAKAAMDDVVTKAESDAIFDELKVSAKADLAAYKTESAYKAAQWAEIQAILTEANAAIDASESVTAINAAVESAKAAMDAVKTAEQVAADEAAAATVKAELAAYKTESVYKAEQWAEIQAIITEANTAIDNAIGNQAVIDEIATNAKAAMDAVKTAEQVDAEAAVVAAAKAELAAYKTESNYKAEQWAEIQAIITEANTAIDNATGDEAAINGIVTAAKAEMDNVKTAKEVAKDEVRAYYNAIDHDLYSEEAEEVISGYMATVMAAIDGAATIEEMDAAIAQFKANVESVETKQPAGNDNEEEKSSGCGGSLVAGSVTAGVALAAAVAVLLKKKED